MTDPNAQGSSHAKWRGYTIQPVFGRPDIEGPFCILNRNDSLAKDGLTYEQAVRQIKRWVEYEKWADKRTRAALASTDKESDHV